MSETSYLETYRERIRYEELLLYWLDRINQALQFNETDNINTYTMGVERAVRSVRAFYSLLPRTLREEIDRQLGKPVYEYLNILQHPTINPTSGKFYLYGIYPRDLANDFEKDLKKCRNEAADRIDLYHCAMEIFRKYSMIILKRLEETLNTMIDVLHDHGLLFREEFQYEGIESESNTQ
ncbi:MAG: hypothetical protein CBR30_09820 [Dictyoglomus sp. NZ13-RE01]|nr:MAG: hypothetical protein CBR30_09820 [Dictyoglomus sp. NZ13-RE01]